MSQETLPIPSATLMLVHGSQDDFEVLMVERNVEIEFAGGAFVFPGGKIAEADKELAQNGEVISAKIAAIRETFEETGILLAINSLGEPIFENHKADMELRLEIEKNPARFTDFLAEQNYTLLTENLTTYAIWVTPKQYKRRFATWFFIAQVPQKFEPIIDGKEAVSAQWLRPQQALDDNKNGNKIMMFPTICNLKMLDKYRDFVQIKIAAGSRETPIIDPIPQFIDGKWEIEIDPKYGYEIE
ncbi:MAG: NUDIX hydrolase [Hyphomonadaceae bacterium]|nr:MAG: NUDIX hydrolase [Hyphomonadaceae bacterium]KAF0186115.1 MAG: NUDIX hydrolase [Hyphomonadaceae bacterium]